MRGRPEQRIIGARSFVLCIKAYLETHRARSNLSKRNRQPSHLALTVSTIGKYPPFN